MLQCHIRLEAAAYILFPDGSLDRPCQRVPLCQLNGRYRGRHLDRIAMSREEFQFIWLPPSIRFTFRVKNTQSLQPDIVAF